METLELQKEVVGYYDRPELSHSKLKKVDKSYNNYEKPFEGNSRAMYLGTLLDLALFEREKFEAIPDAEQTYKYKGEDRYYKFDSVGFQKEADERGLIFEQGLRPTIDKAVETIKNHPIAMDYLQGNYQTEIFTNMYGRDCKGKLDVYNPKKYITDFKTTNSIKGISNTERGKKKALWWVYDWSYHTQLAFYNSLLCSEYGYEQNELDKYIVVYGWEEDDVVVIQLSEDIINEAENKIVEWIDRLNAVEVFGAFKGISDEVIVV